MPLGHLLFLVQTEPEIGAEHEAPEEKEEQKQSICGNFPNHDVCPLSLFAIMTDSLAGNHSLLRLHAGAPCRETPMGKSV